MLNLLWFQFLQCDDTLLFSVWWWFYIIFWHLIKTTNQQIKYVFVGAQVQFQWRSGVGLMLKSFSVNKSQQVMQREKKKKRSNLKRNLVFVDLQGFDCHEPYSHSPDIIRRSYEEMASRRFQGWWGSNGIPLVTKMAKMCPLLLTSLFIRPEVSRLGPDPDAVLLRTRNYNW